MKNFWFCLLLAALLQPPLLAQQSESDPLVDLLNNRNFDREALINQHRSIQTTVSPPPADEEATPAAGIEPPADPTQPGFRPLTPQLPPDAQRQQPIDALALVLPLNSSGAAAAAAEVFHQGCVDALNAVGSPIRVDSYAHDGGSEQAIAAYQQAVEDGLLFVIGPLQKNNVKALLAAYPQAPVRTLLLQPAEPAAEPVAESAYYVLTIDLGEEAAELARLLQEQRYRVIVVGDETAMSRRQQTAFAQAWAQGNNPPLDYFYVYDPQKDWQRLFNQLKDQKAQLTEQTEDGLPPLALFAAGNGDFIRRARNFVPIGYPLYASSIFFSVNDDTQFLDNLRIMEMPWFIRADDEHIRAFASPLVRTRPVLQQRFYALGADACRIAQQHSLWYDGWRMEGASGHLELAAGTFRRRGILSQYESGYLTPLR